MIQTEIMNFFHTSFNLWLSKHASPKTKIVTANNAPFPKKTFRKQIYKIRALKISFSNIFSIQIGKSAKSREINTLKIRKKCTKEHFKSTARYGIMTYKKFWATIRPFLTNKGVITSNEISLKQRYDEINYEGKAAEFLNNAYINVVESTSCKKPLRVFDKDFTFSTAINTILEEYKYHPSVLENTLNKQNVSLFLRRPPTLIKTASNFLVEPLTDIINSCFSISTFADLAKRASVTPIDKGGTDKHTYTNYRPVSVLNTFSEIIQSLIFDQLTKYSNEFLQIFVGPYRKLYSNQQIPIRLIEEWKTQLDKNKTVGAVLLDLSKAFDGILHDPLTAKFDAYGLIYSYLKNWKQSVRINKVYNTFFELIPGVPQESVLGVLLPNNFLNDLYFSITKASFHNYADDNTLSAYVSDLK